MPRPRSSRAAGTVTLRCSIEGPSAFKMDGDGAGQIKLSFPHTEAEQVKELMTGYRECSLLVVFTRPH